MPENTTFENTTSEDKNELQNLNLVTLAGRLSRPAAHRTLPSGDVLASFEVTVHREVGPAETVPVVWFGARADSFTLDVNQPVVVVGRVRRRYFRALGALESRTEVVAEVVLPSGKTPTVRRAFADAMATLQQSCQ